MSLYVCPNCGSPNFGAVPTNVDAFDMIYSTNKSYCKKCGFEGVPLIFEENESYQEFLKSLGSRSKELKPLYGISSAFDEEVERNPFIAALLSFFLPGIGQAYNKDMTKAWFFFIFFIVLFYFGGGYLMSFSVSNILARIIASDLSIIAYVVFWFFAVVDAFLSARYEYAPEEEEDVSELDSLIEDLN